MNHQPDYYRTPITSKNLNKKNKLIWSLVFLAIAVLSIWTVTSQSKGFSFSDFLSFIRNADPFWLGAAFLSMLGFIIFEGAALYSLCKGFGHKRGLGHQCVYSAADIYFSAITPSASGGQPACAYLMMRDGIPAMVVTVTLIVNLALYAIAILGIGLVTFLASPTIFISYRPLSIILIVIGYLIQILLSLFFIVLVAKKSILHRLCAGGIRLLGKLHILRKVDERLNKLNQAMEDYGRYAELIAGQRRTLVRALIFNILQRLSQIAVTAFTYMATVGDSSRFFDVLCLHSYTVIGSNCVPIPGAMGVSDYLLIDGFGGYLGMASGEAANLELLSRSISFYSCIVLCGLAVIIKYFMQSLGRKAK